MENSILTTCHLPGALHKRVKKWIKSHGGTMAELVRRGLEAELNRLEAAERARIEAEEAAKRARHRPLAPLPLAVRPAVPVERADPFCDIYDAAARTIASLIAQRRPGEVGDVMRDAIALVKRRAPITGPNDLEVIREIERRVMALPVVGSAAPAAPVDAAVNAEVERVAQALGTFAQRLGAPAQPQQPALMGRQLGGIQHDAVVGRTLASPVRTLGNVVGDDGE